MSGPVPSKVCLLGLIKTREPLNNGLCHVDDAASRDEDLQDRASQLHMSEECST